MEGKKKNQYEWETDEDDDNSEFETDTAEEGEDEEEEEKEFDKEMDLKRKKFEMNDSDRKEIKIKPQTSTFNQSISVKPCVPMVTPEIIEIGSDEEEEEEKRQQDGKEVIGPSKSAACLDIYNWSKFNNRQKNNSLNEENGKNHMKLTKLIKIIN